MKYAFLLLGALLFLSGCATTTYTKNISQGVIQESDVVIAAVDGSFRLQGEFKAPFQSKAHYHSLNIGGEKLIKGYQHALGFGAKHVRIKVPSAQKELYGVLTLDDIDERGFGPGVSSYKIIIPEPYVNAAKDGKISVVYEYYHIKDDALFDNSNIKKYSWILWLSDKDVFK
ncbi:MAG: hypothetical protein PHX44_08405 [Sulfurimonas sp.]|uniref:hypothetical protein n=1 Tax=Sulfurimonas sp. TaxID=2022749 RepID=UPI0026102C1C|nr:hypothetical protein [Sulfurimonas sp.]MDD2653054.1 hypothetical protein [Sulfurimonas sp.]MDD3452253.1 hypothetical protein [Sulfurimonas sp.]